MSPQVETKPALAEPAPKLHTKIACVSFVESVTFANQEYSSVNLDKCESIFPGRLLPDGSPALLTDGQVAAGLILRTKSRPQPGQPRCVEQSWVPMTNVKSIQYTSEKSANA